MKFSIALAPISIPLAAIQHAAPNASITAAMASIPKIPAPAGIAPKAPPIAANNPTITPNAIRTIVHVRSSSGVIDSLNCLNAFATSMRDNAVTTINPATATIPIQEVTPFIRTPARIPIAPVKAINTPNAVVICPIVAPPSPNLSSLSIL